MAAEIQITELRGGFQGTDAPRLEEVINGGGLLQIVNVAHLEFFSAASFGVLVREHRRLVEQGGDLVLSGSCPWLANVLQSCDMSNEFSTFSCDEAAVRHFAEVDRPTVRHVKIESLWGLPD